MIGRISFYNQAKGYGFIAVTSTEAQSQEFFFHYSNFKNRETPALGAYVSFGLAPGIEGKKPQAVGIRFTTPYEIQYFQLDGGLAALVGGVE